MSLHAEDRKLVKFEFEDQLYEFTALPQGLAYTANRVFSETFLWQIETTANKSQPDC